MRQGSCRMPGYVKAVLGALVIAGIITGLVFMFKSRTQEVRKVQSYTKYTPYSVPHLLANQKFNKLMTKDDFNHNLQGFSQALFGRLMQENANKNLIISPFTIETCLAMVRMGAEGETAYEMDVALNITAYNGNSLTDNFLAFLREYDSCGYINMANRIYVNKYYELQDDFKEVVSQKFLASAENVDFSQMAEAAYKINTWVEQKTNHLIKNLVAPDSFNADTMSMLLSAIHFQDEWKTQFDKRSTAEADFYVDDNHMVKTQMMHILSDFAYQSLPNLNAQMVQLPYKNSNLSMVILLPNSRSGLGNMMASLKSNFLAVTEQLKSSSITKLDLKLPKFKAEFEVELNDILKKMGMQKAFKNGEFHKMLKTSKPIAISKVVHKAFIDVDEVGTKAAAATGAIAQSRTLIFGQPFVCDHPFYYMIVNADYVPLFQGTVVNF